MISHTTHRFPPFVPCKDVLQYFGLEPDQEYWLYVPKDLSDPELKVHVASKDNPLESLCSLGVYDAMFIEPLSNYLKQGGNEQIWTGKEIFEL